MKWCFLVVAVFSLLSLSSPAADSAKLFELTGAKWISPEFQDALATLKKGEIDQIRDAKGRTLLHSAAQYGHQACALTLLLAQADVDARDADGFTPIFAAIKEQDPQDWNYMIVEMLAMRGADLNARSKDGTTPLARAVEKSNFRVADFLIWRGASVNPAGVPEERLPMTIAITKENPQMIKLLQAALVSDSGTGGSGDASRTDSTTPGAEPTAALVSANLNGIEDALTAGWNINRQDENGQTALYRAIKSDRADVVTLLLFEGADPNLAQKDGLTPLMRSTWLLSTAGQRMLALLLLRGADIDAVAKDGKTALAWAASSGNDAAVQPLVYAGSDVKAKLPLGSVADYATHAPTIWLLRHFGAPAPQPTPESVEPGDLLSAAASRGDLPSLKAMLQSGISPHTLNRSNGSPLGAAVFSDHFAVVDYLLSHGVEINEASAQAGDNFLHYLVTWGYPEANAEAAGCIVEQLLKRGANPNAQNKALVTPMMEAARVGATGPSTELLVKAGAVLSIRNREGLTALGVAEKYGQSKMVAYLKAHGGVE